MTSVTPLPQSDSLLALARQESHLQTGLQKLLDAQSEGLLSGLGHAPKEASSAGSRTPTTDSGSRGFQRPGPIVPVRQPSKRRLGLRGARREISRAILQLADLKDQEVTVLEDEVAQRGEVLSTVQGFERKSTGLQEKINGIESEDTNRQVNVLKEEAKVLDSEIHELEARLYEMKARQRHLLREIDGLNNSVQSKLSSYKSALALAEKDIKNFLSRPPLGASTTSPATGVWSLPRERRTLEMAKDHYTEEIHALEDRLLAAETEKNALEEGSVIWKEVVQEVNSVEKLLREEMQKMQVPLLETTEARSPAVEGMEKILKTMRKSRSRIESKLDLAETRNWKLLVCSIGAELEALIEGQRVLEGALRASGPQDDVAEDKRSNGTEIGEEGLDDQQTSQPAHDLLHVDRSEDEDEGPGPEFLLSHHDE